MILSVRDQQRSPARGTDLRPELASGLLPPAKCASQPQSADALTLNSCQLAVLIANRLHLSIVVGGSRLDRCSMHCRRPSCAALAGNPLQLHTESAPPHSLSGR